MNLLISDRRVQQRVGAHTALAMLQFLLITVGYGSGLSLQFGGRLATTSYSGLSLLLMLLLWATVPDFHRSLMGAWRQRPAQASACF